MKGYGLDAPTYDPHDPGEDATEDTEERIAKLEQTIVKLREQLDRVTWHPATHTVHGYQRWCRLCSGVESRGHEPGCAAGEE